MRIPRLIAIVLACAVAATVGYLALATALPRVVILLVLVAAVFPYVLWLGIERNVAARDAGPAETEPDGRSLGCAHCGRPLVADPAMSRDIFEGMHWLCFHLEFEHPGDPDLPCSDTSCPQWRLQIYEAKLRELGVDPAAAVGDAIEARFR